MQDILQKTELMPEILLIDKPLGWSSFDVIRHLRKQLGIKKMGHAGTLDPLATGLMIIGVAAGTKKLKDLIGLDKTYEAEILLGESTTTGDAEGAVTATTIVKPLDNETIKSAVEGLRGVLNLPVPLYCAIKVRGQRLYKLARQGKPVTLPVKTMKVLDIKMRGLRPTADGLCIVSVEMSVSSGTYVRSVAVELGRRLGYPARLNALRRTRIGQYSIKDAFTVATSRGQP